MFLASTHDNLTERHAVVMRLVQGLQPTWRHSKAKVSTSRIFENGLLMIFIWIVSVNKAPMWLLFCGTRRLFVLHRVCARCDILLGKHFRCDLWYTAKLRYKYFIWQHYQLPFSSSLQFCVEKWHCYWTVYLCTELIIILTSLCIIRDTSSPRLHVITVNVVTRCI